MRYTVWKLSKMEHGGYMLMSYPSGISIFFDKLKEDRFKDGYELYSGGVAYIVSLNKKYNRIENFHLLDALSEDKQEGLDEPEGGSVEGSDLQDEVGGELP